MPGGSVTVRFLGTGAAGGTPGRGRSGRLESSALVRADASILLDVTRHFTRQATALDSLDAILLTHAHRDACGGIAQLRSWWREHLTAPVPVYASGETIAALEHRYARLDHCRLTPVRPGEAFSRGRFLIDALEVPHAYEERYPTFAWRLRCGDAVIVYASDVARLTDELERFARGASLLVLDGAMWKSRIFSHLTIDEALPQVCAWSVAEILLTQIGRTAPPHAELERAVARLCDRARPAHDGLSVELAATGPAGAAAPSHATLTRRRPRRPHLAGG